MGTKRRTRRILPLPGRENARRLLDVVIAAGPPVARAERTRLARAVQLLDVFDDRYVWYSENKPTTEVEEVRARLAAWLSHRERLQALFVPAPPARHPEDAGEPAHPLARLVRVAQLLWTWYELEEAAPLIEHALEMAETACLPRSSLAWSTEAGSDPWRAVWEPRHYHVLWFRLAEIAERRGDLDVALAHYGRFLTYEGEFAPALGPTDPWFYYRRVDLPTSVEAWRRIGRLRLARGDARGARDAWTRALALPYTRQSPFVELAELEAADGRTRAALRWRERGLSALTAHPHDARGTLFDRWSQLAQAYADAGYPEDRRRLLHEAVAAWRTSKAARHTSGGPDERIDWSASAEELEILGAAADAAAARGELDLAEDFYRCVLDALLCARPSDAVAQEVRERASAFLAVLHRAGRSRAAEDWLTGAAAFEPVRPLTDSREDCRPAENLRTLRDWFRVRAERLARSRVVEILRRREVVLERDEE